MLHEVTISTYLWTPWYQQQLEHWNSRLAGLNSTSLSDEREAKRRCLFSYYSSTSDGARVSLLSRRAVTTRDSFWQMSAGLLLPPSPFASGNDTLWERVARTHSHVITCLSSGWWIWDSVGVRICSLLFSIACIFVHSVGFRSSTHSQSSCIMLHFIVSVELEEENQAEKKLVWVTHECEVHVFSPLYHSFFFLQFFLCPWRACPRCVHSIQTVESFLRKKRHTLIYVQFKHFGVHTQF